jgi:signal transduction histidine kinase
MKAPNLSLRAVLMLTFASVALILVVGYSLLSSRYLIAGMDTLITENLVRAAVAESRGEFVSEHSIYSSFRVTATWQGQPQDMTTRIAEPPQTLDQLQQLRIEDGAQSEGEGEAESERRMYFYLMTEQAGERYYVSYQVSPDKVSQLVFENVTGSLKLLAAIGLGSVLLISLLVWWLWRRMTQPVTELGAWARSLNETSLQQDIPDFRYRDLNEFAAIVRNSLVSVRDALDREQTFLRHASHELRTPISVIRNNIQLISTLKQRSAETETNPKELAAIERIDRASLTMKHLTETLLWLGREDHEDLPQTDVQLDQLLESLAGELKYLLQGKDVELEVTTKAHTSTLPEAAARIVFGNLIRNAFQHTWAGKVEIRQTGDLVTVVNTLESPDGDESVADLGFGLGLALTEKLCEQLGWKFVQQQTATHWHSEIKLT